MHEKSDGQYVEESVEFMNSTEESVSKLENELLSIMDKVLRPIGKTNKNLSDLVDTMDCLVHLNQSMFEEVLNSSFMEPYGFQKSKGVFDISYDRVHDFVNKQHSDQERNDDLKHVSRRPLNILSPLEEANESLLLDDEDKVEEYDETISISSPPNLIHQNMAALEEEINEHNEEVDLTSRMEGTHDLR